MEKFNYREYLAEGWLFREALDSNSQELQVGDSVMVKGRKGTYGPTKITGFAQGGDEQYVKISGIEVDGKFTTMVGEWRVEKVDSVNEAGAKDAYFNRQKRAQKGNWKGSVGKYVEDHRAEIDAAVKQGHGALRAYMRSTMMPALGPEAQEYLEGFLTGYATDQQLHMALYNVLLKGHGLGLHEEQE